MILTHFILKGYVFLICIFLYYRCFSYCYSGQKANGFKLARRAWLVSCVHLQRENLICLIASTSFYFFILFLKTYILLGYWSLILKSLACQFPKLVGMLQLPHLTNPFLLPSSFFFLASALTRFFFKFAAFLKLILGLLLHPGTSLNRSQCLIMILQRVLDIRVKSNAWQLFQLLTILSSV